MPALVVQQIPGGAAEYVFGEIAGIVGLRMQVDTWADDRAGCFALQEQVRSALQTFRGTAGGTTITITGMIPGNPDWDAEAKLWHSLHDFTGWGTE